MLQMAFFVACAQDIPSDHFGTLSTGAGGDIHTLYVDESEEVPTAPILVEPPDVTRCALISPVMEEDIGLRFFDFRAALAKISDVKMPVTYSAQINSGLSLVFSNLTIKGLSAGLKQIPATIDSETCDAVLGYRGSNLAVFSVASNAGLAVLPTILVPFDYFITLSGGAYRPDATEEIPAPAIDRVVLKPDLKVSLRNNRTVTVANCKLASSRASASGDADCNAIVSAYFVVGPDKPSQGLSDLLAILETTLKEALGALATKAMTCRTSGKDASCDEPSEGPI
jgi:hypothetical protein